MKENLPAIIGENETVPASFRCIKNSSVYCSRMYGRVKTRNSYTIQFLNNQELAYSKIDLFVGVSGNVFVFISVLHPLTSSCKDVFSLSHNTLDHVSKIVPLQPGRETIICVPVRCLLAKCVFINVCDGTCDDQYVVSFPNGLLQD